MKKIGSCVRSRYNSTRRDPFRLRFLETFWVKNKLDEPGRKGIPVFRSLRFAAFPLVAPVPTGSVEMQLNSSAKELTKHACSCTLNSKTFIYSLTLTLTAQFTPNFVLQRGGNLKLSVLHKRNHQPPLVFKHGEPFVPWINLLKKHAPQYPGSQVDTFKKKHISHRKGSWENHRLKGAGWEGDMWSFPGGYFFPQKYPFSPTFWRASSPFSKISGH